MNAAFVAVLLAAAQAASGNYALAMLRPAGGVPTQQATAESAVNAAPKITISIPAIPRKIGADLSEFEDLGPLITAQSATVLDAASGVVLFGKRPYAIRPLASITKLLTALTVAGIRPDWSAVVEMIAVDIPEEGHTVFQSGDRATVRDLFTAMLVRSDNGAARALTRRYFVGDQFSVAAAERARALGLPSLRISEPTGLAPKNRGTAIDAARLLRAVMAERAVAERLEMRSATFEVRRRETVRMTVQSTNTLLRDATPHAFRVRGGKTGYLDESGYNLALAVARDGHEVIVVVLGSASDDDRFRDARLLADWTFKNFRW